MATNAAVKSSRPPAPSRRGANDGYEPQTRARGGGGSAALRSARVALRKRFGQHLLINGEVVRNIVAAARICAHETVYEIGPGTGNLTVHLLEAAARVVACELDRDMFRALHTRMDKLGLSHKLEVVNGDFLSVPLPPFDALVANIPYQISSPVLTRIFAHRPLPSRAVIMFQLEFAERMVAQPHSSTYCRLSVNTRLLCDVVRIVMKVDRNQFRPPPKVDSAVVEFVPRLPPSDIHFEDWDSFLRLMFSAKNKTLRSALASNKSYVAQLTRWRVLSSTSVEGADVASNTPDVEHIHADTPRLSALELRTRADLQRVLNDTATSACRANALPLDDFLRLYRALRAVGFRFLPPTVLKK